MRPSRRRHIDWMAVQFVLDGDRLALTPDEKRMVVRRVADRMLGSDDWYWSAKTACKLTAEQLAERMCCEARSVVRIKHELPPADKGVCPVCRQDVWILDGGVVEAHPNSIFEECELSNKHLDGRHPDETEEAAAPFGPRGLAALRPDLYPWLEVTA